MHLPIMQLRLKSLATLAALLAYAFQPSVSLANVDDTSDAVQPLESTQRHYQIARLVTKLSERAHYAKTRIDNDLSSVLLDNYIEGLDANRSFFLQTDIASIDKYRYSMDNSLRSGDMAPAFEIIATPLNCLRPSLISAPAKATYLIAPK
jgi:carboxyl-terminal processing protease